MLNKKGRLRRVRTVEKTLGKMKSRKEIAFTLQGQKVDIK